MHLPPLILDLATILAVAGLMTFIFQKIRQPVVLGYILAGVIVGPHTPPFQLVNDVPSIQTWAELGVIFLMFTLGLEFSFRKLASVGLTASFTAALEVLFFLGTGYWTGLALGWSPLESLFLGAMLSISSTTIIIKALDELKLKTHRFAGLIFGILIVEDLFAILLLVGLSTIATTKSFSPVALLGAGLNLALVVGSWFMVGHFLVPKIVSHVSRKGSNEMLTLVSIGLCLLLVVLATQLGYSPALGAFIMGSILAETKVIHQVEALMAPLRDLFGAVFFVSIGMLIDPRVMWDFKGTIALLCVVTVVGKVFVTTLGSLLSGQTFRNSLQVGLGLAQIGEFSFIIAGLGLALNATSKNLYPIAVAVSLVTTFTTPYLIKYSGPLADRIEANLPEWLKRALNSYVFWWEHKRGTGKDLLPVARLLFRWALNGVIVAVIFNNCFKGLLPKLAGPWKRETTWLLAFVFSAPFIWGMVFASKKVLLKIGRERKIYEAALVVSLPLLTSVFLGILSAKHFPLSYVLPVITSLLGVIYFVLYRRLEASYEWFEGKFLTAFGRRQEEGEPQSPLSNLAPWGTHLYSFQVHPNAFLVGKSLAEAHLRKRLGVNVVALKRGHRTIVAPRAQELVLPQDTLVVLGSDEQLDALRTEVEVPPEAFEAADSGEEYVLKNLRLSEESVLVGKTIQESEFRDHYEALLVGLERGEGRIMNPGKDFRFEGGDVIWLVGERGQIEKVISKIY